MKSSAISGTRRSRAHAVALALAAPGIALCFTVGSVAAPGGARGGGAAFEQVPGEREFTGELIVRPRPELAPAERDQALRALGSYANRRNARTDEFVLVVADGPFRPGAAENAVAADLLATGLFEYACPNWLVYPVTVPDDPLFVAQWHHPMMESPGAWDLWRGDGASEIVLAVTDTGIVTHEDLPYRVPGFNCVTNLPETGGGDVTDINGHGTHVAGCGAAAGNNSVGVSGMGWKLRVMPVRVSELPSGGATYEDLLQGVQWAAENGAKVISTSYSGIGYPPIETTGQYVRTLDASMLWAAGNSDVDHAGWDFEHVVVVGASDQADVRAGFSGFGLGVDLFAPGVSILSTTLDGSYGFKSGTSMATPIANGALAMIRSANPMLSAVHAEYLLFNSCDFWDVEPNSEAFGWGRVNLRRAVEESLGALVPQPPVARNDRVRAIAGGSVTLDVLANDYDPNMDALEIDTYDATTSSGAAVTLVKGTAGSRDVLLIEDVGGIAGTQSLQYTLVEPVSGATSSATVFVDVSVARYPENPVGAEPGVAVSYYELSSPTALPDFAALTPYASEIVPDIYYPSSSGAFAGSGRADNVGAVYTGWIDVPETGFWTLGLTSDDGSRLWIGDDLVVDNDGVHSMRTVRGTRALAQGKHSLRIEYFEGVRSAGLVLAWSGPGQSTVVARSSQLFHGGTFEPADLDGDGIVDGTDLAILLAAWGTAGTAADINRDGVVDGTDLTTMLARWTAPTAP
jgi:thermitase